MKKVSVSSRSYILSYDNGEVDKEKTESFKFPSPLGVIFSLIKRYTNLLGSDIAKFPSPLGVIFSLI